jgi:DNA-binding Lrp family transcriptional regulator
VNSEPADITRPLLHKLQYEFPLVWDPFGEMARRLRTTPEKVLGRVSELLADGTIRRLGPTFDLRTLGFASTLVMGRVAPGDVDAAAEAVNRFEEVTHNYLRSHEWNLWFTVIARTEERVEEILADVRRNVPGGIFHSVPATRIFKISARFSQGPGQAGEPYRVREPVVLPPDEVRLAGVLQQGLSVAERPFRIAAAEAGMSEGEVLAVLARWLERGVLRWFGAVLRHTRVGFAVNAMCTFVVKDEALEEAGRICVETGAVTHCYARRTPPGWPFNFYAMVHGTEKAQIEEVARRLGDIPGVGDWVILYSERELKKTSKRYFP